MSYLKKEYTKDDMLNLLLFAGNNLKNFKGETVDDILDKFLNVNYFKIQWWNNLGGNPLTRVIIQGQLATKHYGVMRKKTSSLSDSEIENIYDYERI